MKTWRTLVVVVALGAVAAFSAPGVLISGGGGGTPSAASGPCAGAGTPGFLCPSGNVAGNPLTFDGGQVNTSPEGLTLLGPAFVGNHATLGRASLAVAAGGIYTDGGITTTQGIEVGAAKVIYMNAAHTVYAYNNSGANLEFGATSYTFPFGPVTVTGAITATTTVKATTGLLVGANLALSATTPTLTSFGGTGTSITGSGAAFDINVGTVAPGNTGTITLSPAATNGYVCHCYNDTTTTAINIIRANGSSTTTTCTIAQVVAATNIAANWTASDHLRCTATGY